MKPERAIELLRERIEEGRQVIAAGKAEPEFAEWKTKSRLTLVKIYGEDHSLLAEFDKVSYSLPLVTDRTPDSAFREARDSGIRKAMAIMEGAVFERQQLATTPTEGGDTVDPELWEHVSNLVEGEQWSQLASTAATFVEDKIRGWAGLGASDYGKNLMVKVFRPEDGRFPCGNTASEEQGWLQLATGFVLAISNVDRHRIQKRADARTYAMGVLGNREPAPHAASLPARESLSDLKCLFDWAGVRAPRNSTRFLP